jgi:hypothetical protein
MKHIMYVLLPALLFLAAGCNPGDPCLACREEPQLRRLELALSTATKGSAEPLPSDSQVTRCQLYVFSRDGNLVNCYQSSDGRFDFYLTDETYDFVAVANKEDLPVMGVTRQSLGRTETTLAENAEGGLVMVGRLDNHIIESDEKITVEMKRLVAKVSYVLHTDFSGPLAAEPFQVEDIYLTNVVGAGTLAPADSLPASDALWYNRMNREDRGDEPAALLEGGPCFYTLPNASPDSHDKEKWGSRCTRFVVKATLAGRTTYYPVTLERVRANHHYHIDLTIAGFGVDHPEDRPEDYKDFQGQVSVAPWKAGGDFRGDY